MSWNTRITCLALFLLLSVRLAEAADPEPPPRGVLTSEQLQKTLLRMKGDLQRGAFDHLSPDALKLLKGIKPGDMSNLIDALNANPTALQKFKDLGLGDPKNSPKDREKLKSLLDQFQKNPPVLPPGVSLPKLPVPKEQPSPPGVGAPLTPGSTIDELRKPPTDGVPPPLPDQVSDPESTADQPQSPDAQRRERTAKSLAKTWEKLVGPLEDNPALRNALMEMVVAGEGLKGPGGGDLWKFLEENAGSGSEGFGDFLEGFNGDWKLPKLDFSGLDLGGWNLRGSSDSGGSSGSLRSLSPGSFSTSWLSGSWMPVILLVAIVVGALLVWRFRLSSGEPRAAFLPPPGLGPWPVDPRHLANRADVVTAFEYLSVLHCGDDARAWNHVTIAGSLGSLAADDASAAQVARLYAQARYAPGADEFSPADLAEARRHICRLAGVA